MPTLVVEDGSGVSGANTYGIVADARTYAANRGVTLSTDDNVVGIQLINAMDYLESLKYLGRMVSYTQSLQWPRQGLYYDPDTPVPSNVIPPNLINAQYQLCIEQFNGIELQPDLNTVPGQGYILEEKVDVLDTKYSEKIGTTGEPIMPKVDALLRGLVLPTPALRTVRV